MIVVVFVVKGTVFAQMWYINFVTLPGSLAVSSQEESFKIVQSTTFEAKDGNL